MRQGHPSALTFRTVLLLSLAASLLLTVPSKAIAQTYIPLHNFSEAAHYPNDDGVGPYAGVVLSDNALFGTTQAGGTNGAGTVYKMKTDGTGFVALHSFYPLTDGSYPYGGLIVSSNVLYGTTGEGGSAGSGTIFKVNTDGTGFTTLYNFTAISNSTFRNSTNADGAYPRGSLVLVSNTLYGTALEGGLFGHGIVFKVQTDGTGFLPVHSFTGSLSELPITNIDGAHPSSGLVSSSNMLYGAAYAGGQSGVGTVFAINIDDGTFTTLHNFAGGGVDGAEPLADMILSGNTLYGTTYSSWDSSGTSGVGSVFRLQTDGSGFRVLHIFRNNGDGMTPYGGLALRGNWLYGTTIRGGGVFAVNTNGAGFKVVYELAPFGGQYPSGNLIWIGDSIVGTTAGGGDYYNGTVCSILLFPKLTITRDVGNIVLHWATNATAFSLQAATNFVPPTAWTTVSSAPVVLNGMNWITNPISSAQRFYRLSQ